MTNHLMHQVFNSGGLIYVADGTVKARNCSAALIEQLRQHKPVIQEWLQSIYELAPEISPELIAAIWRYSFRPDVLSDEQNKKENVLFLAELARDHPSVIMRHCTELPTYLAQMNRETKEPPQ